MKEYVYLGKKNEAKEFELHENTLLMACSVVKDAPAPEIDDALVSRYKTKHGRTFYLVRYEKNARTKEQKMERRTELIKAKDVLSVMPVYNSGNRITIPTGQINVYTDASKRDIEDIVRRKGYRVEEGKEGQYLLGYIDPSPKMNSVTLASVLLSYDDIHKAEPIFVDGLERKK